MRKELVQLSVAATFLAVALLGCASRPSVKPTEAVLLPTAVPTVAVLRANDAIVRAYNDLDLQPVYELVESADLKVVNLSPRVIVYPEVIRRVMSYFSELARSEQLKGRQSFISALSGQTLTFTVSPAKENPQLTVIILSSNVVPLPEVKMSATTYPNAFFLEEDKKRLLFVNAEVDADKDDYGVVDRPLFPDSLDRINNSLNNALCDLKVIIQSSNQRSQEIKRHFCHVKAQAFSAVQQKIPYQRFVEWARSPALKKLLGSQDSVIPSPEEYSRIPSIYGNAIVPVKR